MSGEEYRPEDIAVLEGIEPKRRTRKPEFLTERLRLRPFQKDDLISLERYALRECFWRFLPIEPQTSESVASFLDKRLKDVWGDGGYCCAIELIEAGHLIGTVRITEADPTHHSGDIGYALNDEFSGKGYMTEAVTRALQIGFQQLHLHRIWATADVDNVASWRLMERVGMQREGLLRQNKFMRGQWRNSYQYSILRDDRAVPA